MNADCSAEAVVNRLMLVVGVRSERELSRWFGYGLTTITSKRQRGSIPYEECVRLATERDLSLDWLILGRGEAPSGVVSPLAKPAEEAQATHMDEFVDVPLYDLQAAAGNGRLFSEEKVKHVLHFRREWIANEGLYAKNLVALDVAGDSMADTLLEGDTVLVNRAVTARDGVFLLRMGEALRIKRVQWRVDGALRLSSDNEMYEPEIVQPENLGQIEILGHCHWRGGRVY
jgi:phage repressor protein C with HTH and peptisase S24 domain